MTELPRISDAEWDVMEALWERSRASAADVASELTERRGWSDRTVKTLLARLVKKGVLGFEVEGQRYLYHPLIERAAYVSEETRSFLGRVRRSGAASPLLATFVREANLNADDVDELRRLLDELEQGEEGQS